MEIKATSRKRRMLSLVILTLLLLFCAYLVLIVSPYMLDVALKLAGGDGSSSLRASIVGIAFVTPLAWGMICFLCIIEEMKLLKQSV
jgi:hypothetical protein